MGNWRSDIKIAIVIPAHNEALTIVACLQSVQYAIDQLPSTISAYPLVVLDSCSDETLNLVKSVNVDFLSCDYRCVGQTRDLGVRHAITAGANWLACTDADSMVTIDWLIQQLAHIQQQPTDMICGVVDIDSWTHLTPQTREDYIAHYQDKMGHRHIHGANLNFSGETYLAVGGFASLPCHEDVDLVSKFINHGSALIWSNKVRVVTSGHLQARAAEGFAAFLENLEKVNLTRNG